MRIIIIGAGISGLCAAYYFSQQGHDVNVFDRDPEVGGLAGFFLVEETYLEKYYHHSFTGHTNIVELMQELNIEGNLFFNRAKMGFLYNGRIYPFATAKDLLFFNPLKITNRIRLGLTSFLMMRIQDWHKLEQRSALEWLRTYSGEEVCKIIWGPLLKMKFGDDYDQISAAWLWNRVVDRRGVNKKGGSREVLGYVKGGYKILFDALKERIKTTGGQIHTGAPVHSIVHEDGRCIGVRVNNEVIKGDVILSTVSTPAFLQLARYLPEGYSDRLASIKYQGSTCVVLQIKQALSKYYWINVSDPNSPFVGIIEHTNLVSPENYGNKHVVYLTKYSASKDSIFEKSDESIYQEFVRYLKRIFPALRKGDIEKFWVFQDRFSQPVFVQNYSKVMPEISTPIQNLYFLNTTQIYPQSRSINSSIAKAKAVVKEILDNHAN